MSGSFCDTNVLLYLLSQDQAKAAIAERLLTTRLVISVQVLNEFAHVARRKSLRTWPEIVDMLDKLRALTDLRPLALETHLVGIGIVGRHQFNLYDAMIVAAALEAGCDTLYSEDMQHGQMIEGRLRIANPFV